MRGRIYNALGSAVIAGVISIVTVPLTYSIFDEEAYIGIQHKSSSQGILNPIQDLQDTPIFTRGQFGTVPNQSAEDLSPRVQVRKKWIRNTIDHIFSLKGMLWHS